MSLDPIIVKRGVVMRKYSSLIDMVGSQDLGFVAFRYKGIEKTYGQFLDDVRSFNPPEGDVVGLFLSNDIETITAFFAMAGKRQLVILNADDDEEVLKRQIIKTHVSVLYGDAERAAELDPYLEKDFHTTDTDILLFTSGTTESARAVVLTESNLCASAFNGGSRLPLSATDVMLSVLPLSHVFGLVCSLLWPLSFGCTVCLGGGLRTFFMDFRTYKPTVASLVPQMARFLAAKKLFNPELKLVLIGAGVCDDWTLGMIKDMGIRVSYGYGLTESSSGIALSIGDEPRAMSICPDYSISIAEDGEILVQCDTTLMKCYYDEPEATERVLKGNVLHTGDIGRVEGDILYITGRKKDIMVFSDGSKIFLPEYEMRLGEILGEGVDFAVVQGKRDEVVLVIRCENSVQKMVDFFNATVARSHQIERIVYVQESLPRTMTGKVKRYDLQGIVG